MGDDTTDLDMFAAVASLRAAGRLRAAIVAVGGPDHEVTPEVTAAADVVLDYPSGGRRAARAPGRRLIVPTRRPRWEALGSVLAAY